MLKSSLDQHDHPLRARIEALEKNLPGERSPLTDAETDELAPHSDHFRKVETFAKEYGLDVVEISTTRHDVVLEGSVKALNAAFKVTLEHFRDDRGTFHAHSGPVHLPDGLEKIVVGVLGLNNIPLNRKVAAHASASSTPVSMAKLSQYYGFPAGASGENQNIALIELGDGCGYYPDDLKTYFADIAGVKMPRITDHSVSRSANAPLDLKALTDIMSDMEAPDMLIGELIAKHSDALEQALNTIETTMDIELAGAVAPRAELHVYFAPGTLAGLYQAMHEALDLAPAAISISWGGLESAWDESQLRTVNTAFERATRPGPFPTTVCCASGDAGSVGDTGAPKANVLFPASSPRVLACGGTSLRLRQGEITGESVWNTQWLGIHGASGGGVSGIFDKPTFQADAGVPDISSSQGYWVNENREAFAGRGVPDVAAIADRSTGVELCVGGKVTLSNGTSAASPIWAGLIALLTERLGVPVGWLNPFLYTPEFKGTCREVSNGDNDTAGENIPFFRARTGWNGCCGVGTPIGNRLLAALRGRATMG